MMLDDIKAGLSRAWEGLAEGWSYLQERASGAITRFHPPQPERAETEEDRTALRGARWGLLAAEVRDGDDEVLVKIEAPGMDADDFEIDVRYGHLIVRGQKRAEREEKRGDYYVMERAYGRFERAVPLAIEVDDSRAKAKYSRGVLTITLPKHERTKPRRIEVRSG